MRNPALRLPTAFALGAVTAFFLDPRDGTRRRHVLRDRVLAGLRRGGRLLGRKSRFAAGKAQGVAAEARSALVPSSAPSDDATVKQRILSDALRDLAVSTKDVAVDVEDGVATLRGSVASSALADDLVQRVREVPGVREVTHELDVAAAAELDQGI